MKHEHDLEVVGEAGDGEEAVRLTRQLKPDVVVMDVAMPKMSGIEATREIKKSCPPSSSSSSLAMTMMNTSSVCWK